MDVSRIWLEIEKNLKIVQIKELNHDVVLNALNQGADVKYIDWTIKLTQPRRIPHPIENSEWVSGILAVSIFSLVSGLRIDKESVRHVCQQILDIEQRRKLRHQSEIKSEQYIYKELDNY
jgi:hypothetical protein